MPIVRDSDSVTVDISAQNLATQELSMPVELLRLDSIEKRIMDEEDFVFGCDYATVIATTDRNKLEELLALITEDDLQTLNDEFESPGIIVYNLNGVYLMSVEAEYLDPVTYEKIEREFVMFGAGVDDVDIPTCMIGWRYKNTLGLSPDELLEIDLEEEDIDEDEAEDLDCGLDFLHRIYEYFETPEQHSEIDRIFEKLDKVLL